MKFNPTEARCVFIDGPVALFIHDADPVEIEAAYNRLRQYVWALSEQLRKVPVSRQPHPMDPPKDFYLRDPNAP